MESINRRQLTLAEVLSKKTVPELRELAKGYYVSGASKKRKSELIDGITLALQEPDLLAELLYIIDKTTWTLFQRAAADGFVAENPADPSQYELLVSLCCLYRVDSDEEILLSIPTEVSETYQTLVAGGFVARKARFDLLHSYALAATNLYGVISQDDFIALFNQQNREKTDDAELFPILIRHIAVDAPYCFWDEYLVSSDFEDNDFKDVPDLVRQIGSKPRYIPQKTEFLRYADWRYYEETEHTSALVAFLVNELNLQRKNAREIVDEIHFACMVDARLQALFDILSKHEVSFSKQQVEKLVELLMQVSNTTRLWSNNGHTPLELHGQLESPSSRPQPLRKKKIGRNDPCPCGSGKKYKKCCGR